jgi:uncharacterized protein YkwD
VGLTGPLVGLAGVARVGAEGAPAGDEIAALFDRLNAYRRERGLSEFGRSGRLAEAAQAHADDMARHNFLSHTSSDGTDLFDRLLRYYPYNTWLGENIAAGFSNAADVLRAWQTSAWHDENLCLPEYQVVGIGLGVNEATAYRWFWTLDFGGQPDEA